MLFDIGPVRTTLVLGGSGVALVPHVCFAALVLEMFLFVSSINAKKTPKVKKHAVSGESRHHYVIARPTHAGACPASAAC